VDQKEERTRQGHRDFIAQPVKEKKDQPSIDQVKNETVEVIGIRVRAEEMVFEEEDRRHQWVIFTHHRGGEYLSQVPGGKSRTRGFSRSWAGSSQLIKLFFRMGENVTEPTISKIIRDNSILKFLLLKFLLRKNFN